MFRFEEPTYLYLLLLLPLLAAFYLYSNYRKRKAIRRFGDPMLMAQLMPDVSKYRPDVKFWLVFVAVGLFAVLLGRLVRTLLMIPFYREIMEPEWAPIYINHAIRVVHPAFFR